MKLRLCIAVLIVLLRNVVNAQEIAPPNSDDVKKSIVEIRELLSKADAKIQVLESIVSENVTPTLTIPVVELIGKPNFYGFKTPKVEIKNDYIQDLTLTSSGGTFYSLQIFFENRTKDSWRPDVKISILNRYGIALDTHSISWITSIPPGERRLENGSLVIKKNESLFRFSKLPKMKDFDIPVFIAIEYEKK